MKTRAFLLDYYDRQGNSITREEWMEKFSDVTYQGVKYYSDNKFIVSTVWLGMNHAFPGQPIHIFETMIFPFKEGECSYRDLYCERYSAEEEALEGHERVVEMVKNGEIKDREEE